MTKTISVLGCGWLGFPLAESLVEKGYAVKGSTTTEEKTERLAQRGITPYVVSFPDQFDELEELLDSDILVLNIPPGTKKDPSGDFILDTINTLIPFINASNCKHLIYTSSTSVYDSENKEVKESYVRNESPLKKVEDLLISSLSIPTTVLRLGGLLGPERTLLRFFSGKEKAGGNLPVNYVIREDVIRAIQAVINRLTAGVFNICADLHPTKEEFYTTHCSKKGMPLPVFTEDKHTWKVINNKHFKKTFGFTYHYPDPLTFPL